MDQDETLRLIGLALKEFPKVLKQKEMAFRHKEKIINAFMPALRTFQKKIRKDLKEAEDSKIAKTVHPWRICAAGEHWVRTFPRKVSHSKKIPNGMTEVEGHCRHNPTKKDQLYFDEINLIASKHFQEASPLPNPTNLGFERKEANGKLYDLQIAGWTQYWNEILKPTVPLEPNLVKALIASESGFRPNYINRAIKDNYARGIMQVTDETHHILSNEKGELKDHFLNLSKSDLLHSNANICAGVRWIFHKQKLATARIKREATWIEAVAEYKGRLIYTINNPNKTHRDMLPFWRNWNKIH